MKTGNQQNSFASHNGSVVGRVHSVETFGTVDGPGIRLVVFCQGCPLRCAYCHNPDTWNFAGGKHMSAEDVLELYERNANYYKQGGITVSGGDPLGQPEFVLDLFKKAHARKEGRIHCCLDTSGGFWDTGNIELMRELIRECDLVILDIKHSDPKQYKWLCGRKQELELAFGNELAKQGVPVLIRHVVVPGITDSEEELAGIGRIISHWPNVCGLELLPYHTMGIEKYKELGIPYRLEGVEPMDKEKLPHLKRVALNARREAILARMNKKNS